MGCTAGCAQSKKEPSDGPTTAEVELFLGTVADELSRDAFNFSAPKDSCPKSLDAVLRKRNSDHLFADPDQTIIFFDWDDTLFASTWLAVNEANSARVREKKGTGRPQMHRGTVVKLNDLGRHVNELLSSALCLGSVAIVTNAKRPWVEQSRKYMQSLKNSVFDQVPIMYALDELPKMKNAKHETDPHKILTETKASAMQHVVGQFYSRYARQSWKNVVSIGDADFEHDAIRMVVKDRPAYKTDSNCYCKTVKLLEKPSIEGLVSQMTIIRICLEKIIQSKSHMAIDFKCPEPEVRFWINRCGQDDTWSETETGADGEDSAVSASLTTTSSTESDLFDPDFTLDWKDFGNLLSV
mmetsp:Transcript_57713/g.153849  ORF Transcript_57713/g.153849 Transcript_57713/m.153849 type:complete len:354 (-) Transcript_57713:656-1717(-)